MIEELLIRNLGVIADARLPLGAGFTAVTGETGAGKTMVVTALGLVLGDRADATAVRGGADQADIDARVRLGGTAGAVLVRERVSELGAHLDGDDLYLGRTVSSEGRSKATIGGRIAPVGALSDLAAHLVVVHGQSEQVRLRSASAQLEALDRFGGAEVSRLVGDYQDHYRAWRDLGRRIEALSQAGAERERELSDLRSALADLAALAPAPGEDAELRERAMRLENVEGLRLAAAGAHESLSSETDSSDALGALDAARRLLERSGDSELLAIAAAVSDITAQVREAATRVASYLASLDTAGPGELDRINERRAALAAAVRKWGADAARYTGRLPSVEALVAFAEQARNRINDLDTGQDRIEAMRTELAELSAKLGASARALSQARRAAAERLAVLVTEELHALALPDARLVVQVDSVEPDTDLAVNRLIESGADTVTFLLAPHVGADPRPIAKSASGGELSRVMLALEVVISQVDPVPTFVFDEIDAGVGGAAAIEIGRRLARLAQHAQVIVVTHLAQVAAFADNHVRVIKQSDGQVTTSSIHRLSGADREAEMARLLSGLSNSASGLAHARELLALAR